MTLPLSRAVEDRDRRLLELRLAHRASESPPLALDAHAPLDAANHVVGQPIEQARIDVGQLHGAGRGAGDCAPRRAARRCDDGAPARPSRTTRSAATPARSRRVDGVRAAPCGARRCRAARRDGASASLASRRRTLAMRHVPLRRARAHRRADARACDSARSRRASRLAVVR